MTNSQSSIRRVVEVVGPAGAGKTTLVHMLRARHCDVLAGLPLNRVELFRHHLGNSGFTLPLLLRHPFGAAELTCAKLRCMAYLRAWEHRLQNNGTGPITVLDHGPIFRLVYLRAFGADTTRCEALQRWCTDTLRRWSSILDVVIWLDAPNAVLLERIHSRGNGHVVKGWSKQQALDLLNRYRTEYLEIIGGLERNPRVTVLGFDTSRTPASEVAQAVGHLLFPPAGPA